MPFAIFEYGVERNIEEERLWFQWKFECQLSPRWTGSLEAAAARQMPGMMDLFQPIATVSWKSALQRRRSFVYGVQ
jgi:hypothetical protein